MIDFIRAAGNLNRGKSWILTGSRIKYIVVSTFAPHQTAKWHELSFRRQNRSAQIIRHRLNIQGGNL
jgi:hypothetical protein